jgi:phasin family protein
LNLSAARSFVEDSVAGAKGLFEAREPQALAGYHVALTPSIEKAAAYSRTLYEIASQTQGEIGKLFEAHFSELNKTVNSALEQATKNAPAGSDVAVAAVKSAIAAANSAYNSVSNAVKQATEIAESNITAAANAAVDGATNSSAKARKVAA